MYKTYIISLSESGTGDHLTSAKLMLPHTIAYCNRYNWSHEVVNAVNGYTLNESLWDHLELKMPIKTVDSTQKFADKPGAQGCFLSHFMLWNRCIELGQPIIILEDDAEVVDLLPEIKLDLDLVKLHKPRMLKNNPRVGAWSPGAFAYWVSPVGAKKLVEFVKMHGPTYNDKLIGSNVLNWGYLDTPIVNLGKRGGSSTNPEKYPYKNLH